MLKRMAIGLLTVLVLGIALLCLQAGIAPRQCARCGGVCRAFEFR